MLYLCTTTAAQPSHAFPNGAFAANLGTGEEEVVMEMNPQQKEFLEMSEEFTEPDECNETDVLQVALNKAALKPWISLVKQ